MAAHQAADGTVERKSCSLSLTCKVERTSDQTQPFGRHGTGIDLVVDSPVLLCNFQVNLSALPGERLARVGLCGRARVACVHKGHGDL